MPPVKIDDPAWVPEKRHSYYVRFKTKDGKEISESGQLRTGDTKTARTWLETKYEAQDVEIIEMQLWEFVTYNKEEDQSKVDKVHRTEFSAETLNWKPKTSTPQTKPEEFVALSCFVINSHAAVSKSCLEYDKKHYAAFYDCGAFE